MKCLFSVFLDILAGEVIFLVAEAAADLDLIQIREGFVKLLVGEASERVEKTASVAVAGIFRKKIVEEIVFDALQDVGHHAFGRHARFKHSGNVGHERKILFQRGDGALYSLSIFNTSWV